MQDLAAGLKEKVVALCEKALQAQEEERYHASNRDLYKVEELLPEPKSEWKAYAWLVSNIGDNHFEQKEYEQGLERFNVVFDRFSDSTENAYLCLRRGQCALELEQTDIAKEMLDQAFALEGKELFEDEHSKYLKFLQPMAK